MNRLPTISDLINPETGKSYRQENNEKQHLYQVGALVEIIGWGGECEYDGMRMYVIGLARDCDGTPLYVLGSKGMPLHQEGSDIFYNPKSLSGFNENALKGVIK